MSQTKKKPFVRARRTFAMLGVVGLLITVVSMFMTATRLQDQAEGATDVGLLGMTLFTAERATLDGGATTASLRPGLGVLVVLVILPAAAAGLVYLRSRWSAAAEVAA